MDSPVVNLNRSRTSRPKHASPPSLPPDGCKCPRLYQLARKLGCAELILLTLTVIGFSVSVRLLIQTSSLEKSSVDVQENSTETRERPAPLKCQEGWHKHRNKCVLFSQTYGFWKESLANCSRKESTLLLIQDEEELVDIQKIENIKGSLFWIGLSYTSKKGWKWTNGSVFNSDVLNITGIAKEGSCVAISKNKMFAEYCDSDNRWICQKEWKAV